VVCAVLAGSPGPVRDAVLLNAAAALVAADAHEQAGGISAEELAGQLEDRLAAALAAAAGSVDSGAAGAVLDRWVKAVAA
jgi:anthranilate phosphoribosyltransferase